MSNTYKDALDELEFSQEQKARMVDRLLQAQRAPAASRPHRRPFGRMAAIGAAAAVLLTVGAGAVVAGLASDAFAPLFGTEHTEIIDKIGRPVGASATDGGVTITADAILGDRNNLNLIYTLEKEDGSTWTLGEEQYLHFGRDDLQLRHMESGGGAAWFLDDDPADNKIQYVVQYTQHGKGVLGKATQTFTDIEIFDGTTNEIVPYVEGRWEITFRVAYEDSTVSLLDAPLLFETGAGTARITKAELSPVGFRIEGAYDTVDDETRARLSDPPESGREAEDNAVERLLDIPITLHRKDGGAVDLSACASRGLNSGKQVQFDFGGSFDREIIPLEEMDFLEIAGNRLTID